MKRRTSGIAQRWDELGVIVVQSPAQYAVRAGVWHAQNIGVGHDANKSTIYHLDQMTLRRMRLLVGHDPLGLRLESAIAESYSMRRKKGMK